MVSSLLNLMILRRDVLIWLAIMRLNFWREIRKGALDLSYAELVNQISKKKNKNKKKALIRGICCFPCCKYTHHGLFQVNKPVCRIPEYYLPIGSHQLVSAASITLLDMSHLLRQRMRKIQIFSHLASGSLAYRIH